jgi:Tol biopolymer transport system component
MTRLLVFLTSLAAGSILLVTAAGAPSATATATTRVSVSSGGRQGNDSSYPDGISGDGRYVVFHSGASNLVPGDTNRTADVFVRDRSTGTTQRVSVNSGGRQANGQSALAAAISSTGRYVAFVSTASNLVPGDTNRAADVFLHDLKSGTTTRVSVGRRGRQGNRESTGAAISADGRFVAFTSLSSNFVRGDTNGTADVFVRDRRTGRTSRVSVRSNGAQASGRTHTRNGSQVQSISADGRFVAFKSDAPNLVRGDTNKTDDVFVHDRRTGKTSRVNLGPGGRQANGESSDARLSADGRYVLFQSLASNLVAGDSNDATDVFLRDRGTGQTTRVSLDGSARQGNGSSFSPWISADGRYLAFASDANNLVKGDTNDLTDMFVRDRVAGTTQRLSLGAGDAQAEGASLWGEISANGRSLAFVSSAANLVPGDTNDLLDVFVRDVSGATFDATSAKPLEVRGGIGKLIVPGDRVDVSYSVYSGSKAVRGDLYVRNDLRHAFVRLPLVRTKVAGAPLHRVLPSRLIRGHRLLYYAVIRDPRSGRSLTLPAAGKRQPASAWILRKPIVVRLGTHRFGETRTPDAVVARARADQVGFENSDLFHFGPQTFVVGGDGSVWLSDGLNQRLLVWNAGRPDTVAWSVQLPFFAGTNDLALGPGGTIYVTRVIQEGQRKRLVLDRLGAAGNVLWERPLGGSYMSPSAWTFVLGSDSPLRVGPDGTLYLLAMMGLPGDEWGWMPVATPNGDAVAPAAQRSGTRWPFQPLTRGLRLVGGEIYSPKQDTAPHDLRYALVDRQDRVVRSWRILSKTDMNFHLTVPERAGGDPVVVIDFLDSDQKWDYEVLRLGAHGTRARFSLSHSVWGSSVLPDLRVGPDGSLYQLSTSPEAGIVISRYSLG